MPTVFKIFLWIGIGILMIASFWFYNVQHFQRTAVYTIGTIINVKLTGHSRLKKPSKIGSRTSQKCDSYRPTVMFFTTDGKSVTFVSEESKCSYRGTKGDQVSVIYSADNPDGAEINNFSTQSGGLTVVTFLGVFFTLVGAIPLLFYTRKRWLNNHLKRNGLQILAELVEIRINRSVQVNGKSPYRIVCQWWNKKTDKVHIFESNDIYLDPTPFLNNRLLSVYLNKADYKKYYVDLSFLPESDI